MAEWYVDDKQIGTARKHMAPTNHDSSSPSINIHETAEVQSSCSRPVFRRSRL